MFELGDKVIVNGRFKAIVTDIEIVNKDNIYTDGKKYLVDYCDGIGIDYMSSSSLTIGELK
jgi:hypothetical protein